QDGVENGECESGQQADLGVIHAQISLDGLYQQRQDLPVDIRHGEADHQYAHHVPGIDSAPPTLMSHCGVPECAFSHGLVAEASATRRSRVAASSITSLRISTP